MKSVRKIGLVMQRPLPKQEVLRAKAKDLQYFLIRNDIRHQDIPAAVMRLEKIYMQLLGEDGHMVADFDNYIKFLAMKNAYKTAVLDVIVTMIASSSSSNSYYYRQNCNPLITEPSYPMDIQKLRNIFKDINVKVEGLNDKPDEYIFGKYAKIAALVLKKYHPGFGRQKTNSDLYEKLAEMIRAIKFNAPAVEIKTAESVSSLRAGIVA